MQTHIEKRISIISDAALQLFTKMEKMMALLDALAAQVESQRTVVDSVIALVQGLADKVAAAGTDATKLQALVDELKGQDDALAAAVAANTPPPPPADVPPTT